MIRAGIYNEKYRHQKAREMTGIPAYGRIDIKSEDVPGQPKMVRLVISIAYSGDNL